jgi:hypothetical protein
VQSTKGRLSQLAHIATVGTAGIFTNVVSDATGLKGLAVAAVTTGSLAAAAWLRKRPRSAVARYCMRLALLLLLAGSLTASVTSPTLSWLATIVSMIIGAAALATQRDINRAVQLLSRMCQVGLASVLFGTAFQMFMHGHQRVGLRLLALGVVTVTAAVWLDRLMSQSTENWDWNVSLIVPVSESSAKMIMMVGQLIFVLGLTSALAGGPLPAATFAIFGGSVSLMGLARRTRSEALAVVSILGAALSIMGTGIYFLVYTQAAFMGMLGLIIGIGTGALCAVRVRPAVKRIRERFSLLSQEPEDNPVHLPHQQVESANVRVSSE